MRGPKPRKNSVTFMPARRAMTKWPSSCRKMITTIGRSPAARRHVPDADDRDHAAIRATSRQRAERRLDPRPRPRRRARSPRGRSGLLIVSRSDQTSGDLTGPRRSASSTASSESAGRAVPRVERRRRSTLGDVGPPDGAGQERLDRRPRWPPTTTPARSGRRDRRRRPGRGSGTRRDRAVRSRAMNARAKSRGRTARPMAVGEPQGVGDGQPHVGQRQLGDRGAVGEGRHRVDDRLRVHGHVDVVVVDAEQLVGLDHLEALVHQRRRIDR